jgi:hypothetical protein
MNARRLGAVAAIITLLASGAYVFVYLYRWEWNRAQVSAAIFIAAEVGLVGWLLADRLKRVERRLDHAGLDGEQRRLQLIRTSAPAPRTNFAWLARPDRTNVFIPVLLGAGAVLSGLAWVVERLARATAGRAAERGLARELGALDLPAGGFLDGGVDPLALLRAPVTQGGRR